MKLYETITAQNWIQHVFADGERRCLLAWVITLPGNHVEMYDRLRAAILVLYPLRAPDESIATFNDHPATRVGDAIRVCKVADV